MSFFLRSIHSAIKNVHKYSPRFLPAQRGLADPIRIQEA
ncbi:Hypothetical protein Minf_1275 [Methylacidiphilum infernorum V4]|uniref:Uncharacterized protein n=1 Tax=Methylacidiphilum infernorum (isolate V4) TaxID=481448 RepID=B3DVH6_METI4|nr:Hypothetical protein Minf_1275 [Methylacidiphilum infernorum V4]